MEKKQEKILFLREKLLVSGRELETVKNPKAL